MRSTIRALVVFWKNEKGLTTVEYAIAGGLVAAGVIGSFQLLGSGVFKVIDYLQTQLNSIVLGA